MSKFDKSRWAESDFSQGYRDEADAYLPYRRTFIEMTTLFYEHFLSQNTGNKVLDLGCGDGFFIEELLKADTQINAVLIDGSQEMMTAAKERLTNHENIQLIQATFQELLTDKPIPEDFDFIFSSLAVHHLTLNEKIQLYNFIHDHLKPGGCFINFDVVLAPTDDLESWYASIWSKWIECQVDLKNRK
ncbi:MAG: class I SAM-dependent methyltransferase, partial [Planctomycetota bacterium]